MCRTKYINMARLLELGCPSRIRGPHGVSLYSFPPAGRVGTKSRPRRRRARFGAAKSHPRDSLAPEPPTPPRRDERRRRRDADRRAIDIARGPSGVEARDAQMRGRQLAEEASPGRDPCHREAERAADERTRATVDRAESSGQRRRHAGTLRRRRARLERAQTRCRRKRSPRRTKPAPRALHPFE